MKTTDDFFIPDNEVKLPEELDYSRVDEYIRSAEAFSRSTYQSVYIIDYFKQNFLYTRVRDKKCYKKVEPTA